MIDRLVDLSNQERHTQLQKRPVKKVLEIKNVLDPELKNLLESKDFPGMMIAPGMTQFLERKTVRYWVCPEDFSSWEMEVILEHYTFVDLD
jgi:hypothetical protein